MPITTLQGLFGDEAMNNTNEVLLRMQGYRTPLQRVKEYFGLTDADLTNTKKLKAAGVKHTPRLTELGVTKEVFEKMFEEVLDFNQTENDGKGQAQESGASSSDGVAEEGSVSNSSKGVKSKKG